MTSQLIELEERFWKGDAEFYETNLTADVLMVFPDPTGALGREAIVESIAASSRWETVEISSVQARDISDRATLIAYRAAARRSPGDAPYLAWVSSLYVKSDGKWKLAFHQQTPTGSPSDDAAAAA